MSKGKLTTGKQRVGESGSTGPTNPFGVALKPVGRNLTLDRGGNAVVTSSKEKSKPEGIAQIAKLKPVAAKDRERKPSPKRAENFLLKQAPLKTATTTTSINTSKSKSLDSKTKPSLTRLSAMKDSASKFGSESSLGVRSPSPGRGVSGKKTANMFNPVTGEIILDQKRVAEFMSETKMSVNDPPWKVQLRNIPKNNPLPETKSSNISFEIEEKDNSRRSVIKQKVRNVPANYESITFKVETMDKNKSVEKVGSNTVSKLGSENRVSLTSSVVQKNKSKGQKSQSKIKKKTTIDKKESVTTNGISRQDAKRDTKKSVIEAKELTESKPKTSPRGTFVTKLVEKCESRDDYKDNNSSDGDVEFPENILDKLAILEGLVSGSSSDESDGESGYDDVAAVIECLAEEGIIDITQEMGTTQHALLYCNLEGNVVVSESDAESNDSVSEFSLQLHEGNNGEGGSEETHDETHDETYENITGLSRGIVRSYDWVEPVWLESDTNVATSDACKSEHTEYELAGNIDWSMKSSSKGDIDRKKRRYAFKNKQQLSSPEIEKGRRRSAPPLGTLVLQQNEEENVYNSPEEVRVPDWDTGSSRVSMAGSESTSSDSVMNNVNIQPHTIIELSNKQVKKLKKRNTDYSPSSARWRKKWQQFYRRSQDLLDIPGLQTKLENLSLSQLPANVKQKLRDRMKKKRGKKSGHLEINPVDEDDDFDQDSHVSSEDMRSDADQEEDIYQTIDTYHREQVPVVNFNIRVSAKNEKIPISPPVAIDTVDSVPDLPPRSTTGSIYEKYSELGPKLPSSSPPSLPPKSLRNTSQISPRRTSMPSPMIRAPLEAAPPLPPRNVRQSLGNLDVRIPLQNNTGSLAESYLHKPQLADKFPSEEPPKPATPKRDSLLLGKVPPPLSQPSHTAQGKGDVAPPGGLGKGYLDMSHGEEASCNSSHESSPERSVPAPFTNVMDFQQRTIERKPSMEEIDIDFELQVSVKRSRYKSRFEREPLYQYYNKDYVKRQSWQRSLSEETSNSVTETAESEKPTHECISPEISITISTDNPQHADHPSLRNVDSQSLIFTTLNQNGSTQRSLWSEVPEVRSSGVAEKLTQEQRKEQEAMFEIITSEASYYKSLNVLINVFVMSPELCGEISEQAVITRQSKHLLFSNIGAVRDASERFLCDLEARWNEGVLISDISDIIVKHAIDHFDPYVKYCTNKTYQDRAYTQLMKSSPSFKEAVLRLQASSDVQGLTMDSFFLLPMQRITRLPLLMDSVCRHRDPDRPTHKDAVQALDALNKLVKNCNEGAKVLEQTEQLFNIEKQLDFKIRKVPIVSSSRHLVKEGELTRIITDSNSKLPFGKRPSKQPLYMFLFNDLLLVTKRKGENQFSVIDYTKRNSVHCEVITNADNFPLLPHGVPSSCKNLFLLAMLENHEGKQMEFIVACNSPSDRTRWMEAFTPNLQVSDHEKIYEEWDCPQVQAIHRYMATEPDELDLEEADVVNVYRKMADGWFEGERIRDGERGWFPESYVEEILSSHVRARNLRLRYRLLIASKELSEKQS